MSSSQLISRSLLGAEITVAIMCQCKQTVLEAHDPVLQISYFR